MLKGMVNFVKGESVQQQNEQEEVAQDVKIETEEKMVQNLKNKLNMNNAAETMNTTKAKGSLYESDVFTNKSQQVKIVKPKTFENAEVIGEAIRDGKVIILDLNKLDAPLATRILDFISGVCFAYNIMPEKVDSKIFMIDPDHKRKTR
jgi:cell division inhibitor SepF